MCDESGNSSPHIACFKEHDSTVQILLKNNTDINLHVNEKNGLSPVFTAFYMKHYAIIKILLHVGAATSFENGCGLNYLSSDWCDKGDITGQYLMRKNNIVDNMFDLDSFFSLLVCCQVEDIIRIRYSINWSL